MDIKTRQFLSSVIAATLVVGTCAAQASSPPSKPTDTIPTWKEVYEGRGNPYNYPNWSPPAKTQDYPFTPPPPPSVEPPPEEPLICLTQEQARKLITMLQVAAAQEVELEEALSDVDLLTRQVNYLEAEVYRLQTEAKDLSTRHIKVQDELNKANTALDECNKVPK